MARYVAQFDSHCYFCGELIMAGEPIAHGPKGTGWCHAEVCAEAVFHTIQPAEGTTP